MVEILCSECGQTICISEEDIWVTANKEIILKRRGVAVQLDEPLPGFIDLRSPEPRKALFTFPLTRKAEEIKPIIKMDVVSNDGETEVRKHFIWWLRAGNGVAPVLKFMGWPEGEKPMVVCPEAQNCEDSFVDCFHAVPHKQREVCVNPPSFCPSCIPVGGTSVEDDDEPVLIDVSNALVICKEANLGLWECQKCDHSRPHRRQRFCVVGHCGFRRIDVNNCAPLVFCPGPEHGYDEDCNGCKDREPHIYGEDTEPHEADPNGRESRFGCPLCRAYTAEDADKVRQEEKPALLVGLPEPINPVKRLMLCQDEARTVCDDADCCPHAIPHWEDQWCSEECGELCKPCVPIGNEVATPEPPKPEPVAEPEPTEKLVICPDLCDDCTDGCGHRVPHIDEGDCHAQWCRGPEKMVGACIPYKEPEPEKKPMFICPRAEFDPIDGCSHCYGNKPHLHDDLCDKTSPLTGCPKCVPCEAYEIAQKIVGTWVEPLPKGHVAVPEDIYKWMAMTMLKHGSIGSITCAKLLGRPWRDDNGNFLEENWCEQLYAEATDVAKNWPKRIRKPSPLIDRLIA